MSAGGMRLVLVGLAASTLVFACRVGDERAPREGSSRGDPVGVAVPPLGREVVAAEANGVEHPPPWVVPPRGVEWEVDVGLPGTGRPVEVSVTIRVGTGCPHPGHLRARDLVIDFGCPRAATEEPYYVTAGGSLDRTRGRLRLPMRRSCLVLVEGGDLDVGTCVGGRCSSWATLESLGFSRRPCGEACAHLGPAILVFE